MDGVLLTNDSFLLLSVFTGPVHLLDFFDRLKREKMLSFLVDMRF